MAYTLTAICTDTGRVDTVEGLTAKEAAAEKMIWARMGRSVTVISDVYETFKSAGWDRIKDAYRDGTLTRKQTTVLLARKGYDPKQVRLILKGWD